MLSAYQGLNPYFGDIHNHCAVGYGHGSIDNAFNNARMQLDFACVSVHAHWGDMPVDDERLNHVVAYHQKGFDITRQSWPHLKQLVQSHNQPGRFITFLGYEWHSLQYGDHNIYYKDGQGEVIRVSELEDIRERLRAQKELGEEALLIPHHIGYRQGYRGINWDAFTTELSPIVEIMSMHGCSESPDSPYAYLHTMGPRDWESTFQYGLAQGHIAGVYASSDHHSAHPGSYGHGRMVAWAESLTRDGIWDALTSRRTVALSGDNIKLAFAINDHSMGSVLGPTSGRHVDVSVVGGGALDNIEVLYNNQILHYIVQEESADIPDFSNPFKVHVEVGWGEKGVTVDWDVSLEVDNGNLLSVEPRFRGYEIVEPQAEEEEHYAFSKWQYIGVDGVHFSTHTWGNLTTTTPSTQGLCLEIQGDASTRIRGSANGVTLDISLGDLVQGPRSVYLGGFLTPVIYFHRAIPHSQYTASFSLDHHAESQTRDWYYIRLRQKNNQYAWSSPIWIKGAN